MNAEEELARLRDGITALPGQIPAWGDSRALENVQDWLSERIDHLLAPQVQDKPEAGEG